MNDWTHWSSGDGWVPLQGQQSHLTVQIFIHLTCCWRQAQTSCASSLAKSVPWAGRALVFVSEMTYGYLGLSTFNEQALNE